MARLAEYMREFADLLGSRQAVRFAGIVKGSAVLRAYVGEAEAVESSLRVLATRDGSAPKEALDHAQRISHLMFRDGARGEITRRDGNVLYVFDSIGRHEPGAEEITISQDGELVGQVIRIGGRDETVPLQLADADGQFFDINIKGRELAKQIASHFFGDPIRVFGTGTWTRCSDGVWKLDRFVAHGFEPLDSRPIADLVNELRAIPDNGWANLDDPIGEWTKLRG